ncbi:MAG: thioesterase family protein [Intrasporangium sp.]|uniref:thioesterase family protein n=1 Tax=Intrasporangium sp. TaxID=1925024 RepID=UPI002648AB13|nr:thioesterase family protein [Intrasporangium sp.]MDN5794281.1 thioesterase family protein [Intrasporangium sp.]
MHEFDAAMQLRPESPGRWSGAFHDGWTIGNAINGGVAMALGLTALGRHLAEDPAETNRHVDPVVLSAYFMTASLGGPCTVETETLRCGRRLSTGQISVWQPGTDGTPVERMRALASLGNHDTIDTARQASPPDLPPPDRCVPSDAAPPDFLSQSPFLDRLDLRLDPDTAGWAMGKPSMRGLMRGWLRLKDGREPDTTMLMWALDAFPPVAFDLGIYGWAPTLEFTGHIRRRPAPGWLRVVLSSDTTTGDLMEEDATIWDSAGNLVAQSRQLCSVRSQSRPARS